MVSLCEIPNNMFSLFQMGLITIMFAALPVGAILVVITFGCCRLMSKCYEFISYLKSPCEQTVGLTRFRGLYNANGALVRNTMIILSYIL